MDTQKLNGQESLNNIFLSPHFDDICFSLGALAYSQQQGHLVNVFTVSNYVTEHFHQNTNAYSVQDVTKIRSEEDAQFSKMCGLVGHNLAMKESPVLGIHPFDLTNLDSHILAIESELISYVLKLQNHNQNNLLYCPMGIGGHRDHQVILGAVIKNIDDLIKKMSILFYFDLPYSSNVQALEDGLANFQKLVKKHIFSTYAKELDEKERALKLKMIGFYQSQIFNPINPSHFTVGHQSEGAKMCEMLVKIMPK